MKRVIFWILLIAAVGFLYVSTAQTPQTFRVTPIEGNKLRGSPFAVTGKVVGFSCINQNGSSTCFLATAD
jgi:hypothetical protein